MTLNPTSSKGGGTVTPAALTLIQTITLAADGVIDFTGIPQLYSDLWLVGMLRGTNAATTETLELHINNDSGTNYLYEQAVAAGSAWTVFGATGSTVIDLCDTSLPAASANAAEFGAVEMKVYGYASTTWRKLVRAEITTGLGTNGTLFESSGKWVNSAAITRLTLFGGFTTNLKAGSVARLYGLGLL